MYLYFILFRRNNSDIGRPLVVLFILYRKVPKCIRGIQPVFKIHSLLTAQSALQLFKSIY